jgi:hypothetical protein
VIELPPTVNMGPRSPWGGQMNRGYIQSWNFTLERKLPADFLVSVGYVGNQTVRQFLDRDINAAPIGTGPQAVRWRRPRAASSTPTCGTAGAMPTTIRCRSPQQEPVARASS